MKNRFLYALVALALSGLGGCSMFGHKDDRVACPATGIIKAASLFPVLHKSGTGKHAAQTAVAEGKILKFISHCREKKVGTAAIALDVAFSGHRTAKNDPLVLPYFIAVLSPDQKILQRQEFTTKIDFDNQPVETSQPQADGVSTQKGVSVEQHVISLPLTAGDNAADYTVAIGFALSPAQLAYDRKHNEH